MVLGKRMNPRRIMERWHHGGNMHKDNDENSSDLIINHSTESAPSKIN
jgi:hypothetical protein